VKLFTDIVKNNGFIEPDEDLVMGTFPEDFLWGFATCKLLNNWKNWKKPVLIAFFK